MNKCLESKIIKIIELKAIVYLISFDPANFDVSEIYEENVQF